MKKLLFSILLMTPGIGLAVGAILVKIANDGLKEMAFMLGLIGVIVIFVFGLRSLFDWYLERYE